MAEKGVGDVIQTGSGNKTGSGSGSYVRKIPYLILEGKDCCIYMTSEIEQQVTYSPGMTETIESRIARENGREFRKNTSSYTLNNNRIVTITKGTFIPGRGVVVQDLGLNKAGWILEVTPRFSYYLYARTDRIELPSKFTLNVDIYNPAANFDNSGEFSVSLSNSNSAPIAAEIAGYVNEVVTVDSSGYYSYNFINSAGSKNWVQGLTGYKTTTYKFGSSSPFSTLSNRKVIVTRKEKIDGKYKLQFYLGTITSFQTIQNNNWLILDDDIEPNTNSAGRRYRTQNLPPQIKILSLAIAIEKKLFASSTNYPIADGVGNGTVIVNVRTTGGIEDLITIAANNGTLMLNESDDETDSNVAAYLYTGYNPLSDLRGTENLFEQYAIASDGSISLKKIDKASIYWSKKQSASLTSVKYLPKKI